MIDGYEEEERMKTVVMMVKAFYICPDPRQGQNNREEPHHAESFPEKENICGHRLSFGILFVQNHK